MSLSFDVKTTSSSPSVESSLEPSNMVGIRDAAGAGGGLGLPTGGARVVVGKSGGGRGGGVSPSSLSESSCRLLSRNVEKLVPPANLQFRGKVEKLEPPANLQSNSSRKILSQILPLFYLFLSHSSLEVNYAT